jgi:hypothetical protein
MPDIVFASKDALPEELHPFLKEADGGKFVINLVPNEKLKEFRETNITVSRERDTLKQTLEKVNAIFPEFDPEKVTTEVTELRGIAKRVKDGSLKENSQIEDALKARTDEMKRSYEDQLKAAGVTLKSTGDENTALKLRIQRQAVRQAILAVAHDEKSGVQSSAIDDIVQRAYGVFAVDDDEKLTPKQGDAVLYGANGTTPMTPFEWVASLKDKSQHLFKQSNGGGGVGDPARKFGGFSVDEIQKMSPEEKLRVANEQNRPRGY